MSDIPVEAILKFMKEAFEEKMPFNKLIGIKIDTLTPETAVIRIDMNDSLVGNFKKKILHGGVVSAVLDFTGSVIASIQILNDMKGATPEALLKRLTGIGTIDMRIDYIRPGQGKFFLATGHMLRLGNKVAVTRTEMTNDEGVLLAVGTSTYLVG